MSDDETQTGAETDQGTDQADESGPGISDEQLPEDVRPSEDNPLAEGPTDEDDDEDEGLSMGEDGPQAG